MKYNKTSKIIHIDKELNDLDKFVLKFINIINKEARYVIISGYVSIILGRSRATEDVDVFIEKIDEKKFLKMYNQLIKKGFWCLNGTNPLNLYENYLLKENAIRFALKNNVLPNMELKFVKNKLDENAINNPLKVVIKNDVFLISPLEQQIAFKRFVLSSQKDLEDALHLEKLFLTDLDKKELLKFKKMFKK